MREQQTLAFDHNGKVAFITGAGSGIGRATALRLAAEGAAVIVADVNAEGAGETVRQVHAARGRALAVHCDVRDRASIAAARDAGLAEFGSITYLVNNAGLVTMESLDELTEEHWDLVLDVNLKGQWLVTQEINPTIEAAGGGAIVNLSTVESMVVVSSKGYAQVHYNASKGGVPMLTKALAVELARKNIRVNAVAPGPIATGFVSLEGITSPEAMEFMSQRLLIQRVGQPDDIAAAISFLLSSDASWITGIQLPVDGGWLTR
ncbi:MAG: SDR family oxidoreductase [Actinomycetota bacterium]|nr:SDR family oxidoreductase [Actinomycetota bacterium]